MLLKMVGQLGLESGDQAVQLADNPSRGACGGRERADHGVGRGELVGSQPGGEGLRASVDVAGSAPPAAKVLTGRRVRNQALVDQACSH